MSVAGDAAVDSPVAATASAPALLSLRDLRVHFQTSRGVVHAVDGINLEITPGETLGLVGETGSGKSVTARSLLRLVPSPPAFYPSGEALFRPTTRCGACSGAGCKVCRGLGRVNPRCDACGGLGCDGCEQSGVDTIDLLKVPERRLRRIRGNHVAMIFQDPGKALNPALSIRQQIAEVFAEHRPQELLRQADLDGTRADFFLRRAAHGRTTFWERQALRLPPLHRLDRRLEAVIEERVATALTDTRIPNPRKVMHSYPHELSGGMKQRVMIAQALACDPDLLIADEPTTALDVTIQVRILDLIAELQKRHGTAVLYISHDLSLVRRISDRVAVMYAGRLAEVGPTARIFANPLHPYTRAMLAATPRPGQRRGELAAIEGSVPELIDPEPSCRFSSRCSYAAPACRAVDPGLHARYGPDHRAACLLYDRAEAIGADPKDMPTMHSAP